MNLLVRTVAPSATNTASGTTAGSSRLTAIPGDVTGLTTSVASFSNSGTSTTVGSKGGAISLDVALSTTAIALFSLGRSGSLAGGGLVTRFETVKASTLGEGAVFGQVTH